MGTSMDRLVRLSAVAGYTRMVNGKPVKVSGYTRKGGLGALSQETLFAEARANHKAAMALKYDDPARDLLEEKGDAYRDEILKRGFPVNTVQGDSNYSRNPKDYEGLSLNELKNFILRQPEITGVVRMAVLRERDKREKEHIKLAETTDDKAMRAVIAEAKSAETEGQVEALYYRGGNLEGGWAAFDLWKKQYIKQGGLKSASAKDKALAEEKEATQIALRRVEDASEEWQKAHPDGELRRVRDSYLDKGHVEMNRHLRGETSSKEAARDADLFNKAFDDAPKTTSEVSVYRGFGASHEKLFSGKKVGDVVTDKAPLSTSVSKSEAEQFGTSPVKISVPSGTSYIPGHPWEGELILPPHTQLRIKSVDPLEVEVVPSK